MQGLKNIVITGANKGLGLGMASHLASRPGWRVIMACRNLELGKQSKEELQLKYPEADIQLESLDVSNSNSIQNFLGVVKQKYDGINVLVNNAGVAPKGEQTFGPEEVQWVLNTNVYGTIELTEKMIPLLADKGKIVTLGSMIGRVMLRKMANEELKKRWRTNDITTKEIVNLTREFEQEVVDGTYESKGWPKSGYGISKLAINLFSSALSRYGEVVRRGIQVYSCCPGFVKTDMTQHRGVLSIEQGIKNPMYLIELPFEIDEELQGKFVQKQKLSSTFG